MLIFILSGAANQSSNSRHRIVDIFSCIKRSESGLLPRTVLQCLPIETKTFIVPCALLLLVKTPAGLIAQHLSLKHLAEEIGQLEIAALVVRVLGHIANDVPKNIQAYQVERAKCC